MEAINKNGEKFEKKKYPGGIFGKFADLLKDIRYELRELNKSNKEIERLLKK